LKLNYLWSKNSNGQELKTSVQRKKESSMIRSWDIIDFVTSMHLNIIYAVHIESLVLDNIKSSFNKFFLFRLVSWAIGFAWNQSESIKSVKVPC